MATVYLGRDNRVTFQLLQNGAVIESGRVVRADLWIPDTLTTTGDAVTLSTSGDVPKLSLNGDSTQVYLHAGSAPLKEGRAHCYLTIYDLANPNGLAWDIVELIVQPWYPEA